jgi:hypothetical protein
MIAGGIRQLADVFVLLFLSLCFMLLGNSAPDLMAGHFAGTKNMYKSYSARHSF